MILPISILFYATCKNKQNEWDKEWEARKALLLMPDPTAVFVPDSLRYLLPILDSVHVKDQEYRFLLRQKPKKVPQYIRKKIAENDIKNLEVVEGIIRKHGWLGSKEIGFKANLTLFMVIQHAGLKTQEKYLPVLKQAVADKKLAAAHYAMLVDRIEMKNKRPQIYGTQIVTEKGISNIYPLLNPDSVEVWRQSVGMFSSLQSYAKMFNIEWDVEEYKKILPELKKKYGVKDTLMSNTQEPF